MNKRICTSCGVTFRTPRTIPEICPDCIESGDYNYCHTCGHLCPLDKTHCSHCKENNL